MILCRNLYQYGKTCHYQLLQMLTSFYLIFKCVLSRKGNAVLYFEFFKKNELYWNTFVIVLNFMHMVLIITQGRVWLNIWWFTIQNKVLNFHNWNLCYAQLLITNMVYTKNSLTTYQMTWDLGREKSGEWIYPIEW